MILPTKGVSSERALIAIGGDVLALLDEPKTVSKVWDEYRQKIDRDNGTSFDWFVLSLDLLFLMGALDLDRGRLERAPPSTPFAEVRP